MRNASCSLICFPYRTPNPGIAIGKRHRKVEVSASRSAGFQQLTSETGPAQDDRQP